MPKKQRGSSYVLCLLLKTESQAPTAVFVLATVLVIYVLFGPSADSDQKDIKPTLPPGRSYFQASYDWQEVESHHICPAGLEYQMDLSTGKSYARLSSS